MQRKNLDVKASVDRRMRRDLQNYREIASTDDFTDMIEIEKEFGSLIIPNHLQNKQKRSTLPKDSLWHKIADRLDSRPTRFNQFVKLIQLASATNAELQE